MKKINRKDFISTTLLASCIPFTAKLSGNTKHTPVPLPVAAAAIHPADQAVKICAFSKNFQWLDYEGMAALAAGIGFDGIDLTVRPGGHVLPERVSEDLPKAVAAVERAGLKVYMLTTAISAAEEKHTAAILQTASALGIGYYRTGWFHYEAANGIPAEIESMKRRLAALAAINKKYQLHGAYQNHAGNYFGASLWDLWLAIKEMDPQYIGCQYDIRHATVEASGSWENGLGLIQPWIKTFAIKDFAWTKQQHKWQAVSVPLGDGAVDFARYLAKVKQYRFTGPLSLHCEYPLGGAEEGAKQLSISKQQFTSAVKTDLAKLKTMLQQTQ